MNPLEQPENDPLDAWREYVAANLRDALENLVPNTGDWHGALLNWCREHDTGRITPNRRPPLGE